MSKNRASRKPSSPHAKYADCMEEIKRRTEVIRGFLSGSCSAMYVQTTAESVCLQVRKILELIALASIAANKDEYEKHRKNFHADWNAKKILAGLEKVNPNFYPKPTKQVIDEETGTVVETVPVDSGYLTKSEFASLYRKCGAILHARNPFSRSDQDIRSFLNQVPQWMERIRVLLNHHEVQLVDEDQHLKVLMKSKSDGAAHVTKFQKITGPEFERLSNLDSKARKREFGRRNAAKRGKASR